MKSMRNNGKILELFDELPDIGQKSEVLLDVTKILKKTGDVLEWLKSKLK